VIDISSPTGSRGWGGNVIREKGKYPLEGESTLGDGWGKLKGGKKKTDRNVEEKETCEG